MKQLHSESQRLVRGSLPPPPSEPSPSPVSGGGVLKAQLFSVSTESSLGLPYHIPEPKTIQQFYRRRARPQGPAMALLK